MVLTIKGKQQLLWRTLDAKGDVLDILHQSRRNKKATEGIAKLFDVRCKGLSPSC